MTGDLFGQTGSLLATDFPGMGTAGMEAASARQIAAGGGLVL